MPVGLKEFEQRVKLSGNKLLSPSVSFTIRRTIFLSRHFASHRYMEVVKTDRKATSTHFARIDFRRARAQVT